MIFSLFLMLASETYCECLVFIIPATVTQLSSCTVSMFFDWPGLLPNLIRSSLQIGSFL
jgi:hypothetical protein